ncbi:MAG: cyclase family protein [Planctomycetaceae bacterium]
MRKRATRRLLRSASSILLISMAFLASATDGTDDGRWIDLTHPFDATTVYWPTEKGFVLDRGPSGVTPRGYFYSANRFEAAEHGGTHIDAPIHFHADGHAVDQVEIDRLVGEAVVVDVSQACSRDVDYQVTADDLVAWERRSQRRLSDVIVILRTGLARHWPDRLRYLGTEGEGPAAVASLHFPGLAPEAATWLVTERRPKAVGIDTASIDHGPSTHFGAHVALCGANVPIFENLAPLERLPEQGAWIVALPMKIAGGSGGPLRIVARLPETPSRAGEPQVPGGARLPTPSGRP